MKEKEKVARPGRLELPTLCLEGRRSIQLSYGRTSCIDFKSFSGRYNTILAASSLCRRGRRSTKLSYGPILAIHSTLLKLQNQFALRFFRASWSTLEPRVAFHARTRQPCSRAPLPSSP